MKLKLRLKYIKEYQFLKKTKAFDDKYYLAHSPELSDYKHSLLMHYIIQGWKKGLNPSKGFNTTDYLSLHKDVRHKQINPLLHYIMHGIKEGRSLNSKVERELPRLTQRNKELTKSEARLKAQNKALVSQISPDAHLLRLQDYKSSSVEKRYAFYTAITGGYEEIKVPEFFDDSIDYFIFTDNEALEVKEPFKKVILDKFESDPVRLARWVKQNPVKLFPHYECAIWVDSNILVKNSLLPYIERVIATGSCIGMYPHPERKTYTEEVAACKHHNKDSFDEMDKQYAYYVENFDIENINQQPLIESNVFIANLKSDKINQFFRVWGGELFRHSRRDQLALPFAFSQVDVKLLLLEHSRELIPRFNRNTYSIYKHSDNTSYKVPGYLDGVQSTSLASFMYLGITHPTSVSLSIMVTIYNAPEEVSELLACLSRQTDQEFQLILMNDGSEQETTNILDSYKRENTEVIHNDINLGYTKTVNKGVKKASNELVMVLNSDTVLGDDFVKDVKSFAIKHPYIDAFGPLSNAASWQNVPDLVGEDGRLAINVLPDNSNVNDVCNSIKELNMPQDYVSVNLLNGFCYVVKQSVHNSVGELDEKSFPRGYGEEDDFFVRLNIMGFKVAIASDLYVYHHKTKSFTAEEKNSNSALGQKKLHAIYSKELIQRLVRNSSKNPHLIELREKIKNEVY